MTRKVTDLPWECGKGWWPLIEKVAAAIDSFNAAHPDSPVEVSQIKQKFGGLNGLVYELSDILWSVIVIDSKSAKFLFDLGDFDRRVRVRGIKGIDGRRDFLDERPPSLTALPGEVDDFTGHRSEVLCRRCQMASTDIMVRATKWPLRASFGSKTCS